MRVLGIDPGSHRLGWGVVEAEGSRLGHVGSGCLQAPAGDLGRRLRHMADALEAELDRLRPQAAAIEGVFFAKNARSALTLGHARGVALLCLARRDLAVVEYSPSQIKQALTGRGGADKGQVQAMVRLLLGLTTAPLGLDQSDALATAICHAQCRHSRLPGGAAAP